ncbi:UNVERIFIED_CONTAM: hypothetical protein Sindi_0965200 [Sesamum indicum]
MVESDFLFATLQLFNLPKKFIGCILECVITPSFSIALNGGIHGFFAGARGLRQDDPMSPYLFVLVMEVLGLIYQQRIEQDGGFLYHWRCGEIGLFQLSFADDLLLFCRANEGSVRLFKDGLEMFASLSGLHTNAAKSHIIFSRSAYPMRDILLGILGFQKGTLPVTYLGLPLTLSRLTITDCKTLLLKIDKLLRGWDALQLSFAVRIQLIKSVFMALQIYWGMAFILPKGIIKEIEKRLCNFLWKGTSTTGYPKVAWTQVCRQIEEGSQGLKDLTGLNSALMTRHIWKVVNSNSNTIWVSWIHSVRLHSKSIWTVGAI